jgi:hypothetical protein
VDLVVNSNPSKEDVPYRVDCQTGSLVRGQCWTGPADMLTDDGCAQLVVMGRTGHLRLDHRWAGVDCSFQPRGRALRKVSAAAHNLQLLWTLCRSTAFLLSKARRRLPCAP